MRLEAFVRHLRELWPGCGIWLPMILLAWPLAFIVAGHGRWEHALVLLGVPLLAYTSVSTKRFFVGLFPIALLGLVYDSMRWVKGLGVTPERVHLCDLRALDMRVASVATSGGQRGSVHDWLQLHSSKVLDVIAAIPYGTFLYVVVGFAIFLYVKDYARMRLFAWTFLLVNLIGFTTYHLYPAAPPWYFHAHGCTVDLAAPASEGPNLARVDAMLGFPYFRSFYGRSSDVFGAMPSLHASYPMLIVLFGWPVFRAVGRSLSALFLATMCFAAAYLDHHWLVDIMLGLTYALLGYVVVVAIAKAARRQRDVPDALFRTEVAPP